VNHKEKHFDEGKQVAPAHLAKLSKVKAKVDTAGD
jgi:hypothetical protein